MGSVVMPPEARIEGCCKICGYAGRQHFAGGLGAASQVDEKRPPESLIRPFVFQQQANIEKIARMLSRQCRSQLARPDRCPLTIEADRARTG
jgi:hypothetical protein